MGNSKAVPSRLDGRFSAAHASVTTTGDFGDKLGVLEQRLWPTPFSLLEVPGPTRAAYN